MHDALRVHDGDGRSFGPKKQRVAGNGQACMTGARHFDLHVGARPQLIVGIGQRDFDLQRTRRHVDGACDMRDRAAEGLAR